MVAPSQRVPGPELDLSGPKMENARVAFCDSDRNINDENARRVFTCLTPVGQSLDWAKCIDHRLRDLRRWQNLSESELVAAFDNSFDCASGVERGAVIMGVVIQVGNSLNSVPVFPPPLDGLPWIGDDCQTGGS